MFNQISKEKMGSKKANKINGFKNGVCVGLRMTKDY
jgi:hypothetical protein